MKLAKKFWKTNTKLQTIENKLIKSNRAGHANCNKRVSKIRNTIHRFMSFLLTEAIKQVSDTVCKFNFKDYE